MKVENLTPQDVSGQLQEDIHRYGTKFGIQRIFVDLDMCGVQTELHHPTASEEVIRDSIAAINQNRRGVTVRFSYRDALNLPRGFFKDTDDAYRFVQENRANYGVIIQEYTKLKNSFELYADDERSYTQVLPGIWEVDASATPDIIDEGADKTTVWRFTQPRDAKYVGDNNQFYTTPVQPYTFDELLAFQRKVDPYKDRLNQLRRVFNPLFCHFYEDDEGRLSFINLRNVGRVPLNSDSPSYFHRVENGQDIEEWDEQQPILFDVKTSREDDSRLVESIRSLKTRGISVVYVNYGVLSHPAILLREAGIDVKQAYNLFEKLEIPNNPELPKETDQVEPSVLSREVVIFQTEHVMDYDTVLSLDEVPEGSLELVGGKAYNLSILKKNGLPVPDGFVVTTKAFERWKRIKDERGGLGIDVSQANKILVELSKLNERVVAVRSSATVEDMSEASSAGVYKTTLNVTDQDELILAVIEGFESFSSDQAGKYRQHTVGDVDGGMALVVQSMVDADASGVLFTRSPLNESLDEQVINATYGIGSLLVSGEVPGDVFSIDEFGQVSTVSLSEKSIKLITSGIVEIDSDMRKRPCLDEPTLQELFQYGKKIEGIFGSPQDIEFAVKEGKIWILQARPITTASK